MTGVMLPLAASFVQPVQPVIPETQFIDHPLVGSWLSFYNANTITLVEFYANGTGLVIEPHPNGSHSYLTLKWSIHSDSVYLSSSGNWADYYIDGDYLSISNHGHWPFETLTLRRLAADSELYMKLMALIAAGESIAIIMDEIMVYLNMITDGMAATRHPFALALEEFFADATGRTAAFLVDIDGRGTMGVLAIKGDPSTEYLNYWGEMYYDRI